MRVVIDTNVLVSAVVKAGKPRDVLLYVMQFHTILSSIPMLKEYKHVLLSSEFDRYMSKEKRTALLTALAGTEIVSIPGSLRISRDPDDDKVIETALAGSADILITGDKDILALRPCADVAITTPNEFVAEYMQ